MKQPDEYDAFYKSARTRLLLQTYALTGDLPASRSAVRDSFVVTWHHWRKVSRLEDREAFVRPVAHRRAQRRHAARPWHRDKGIDDDVRATLDALSKLSAQERRTLVLSTLLGLLVVWGVRTFVPRRGGGALAPPGARPARRAPFPVAASGVVAGGSTGRDREGSHR